MGHLPVKGEVKPVTEALVHLSSVPLGGQMSSGVHLSNIVYCCDW